MIKKLILEKIKAYDTIIIHGHTRPDGDCYGAQYGLKNILKESFPNKHIYVVGQVSEYVSFVGSPDVIEDSLYEGALSIVVDTATSDRVSDQRYTFGKEIIKIDHHIPNELSYYADYYWVEEEISSCSEMIASFYREFKDELKLSHEGALAMYTGMVTDTGRFRYRGVNRQTHEIAGMLLDFGVDVEFVDQKLSVDTMESVRLKGHVLSNFRVTKAGFIYFVMDKETISKFNVTNEGAAAMVNMLSGIEGYPVWGFIIDYGTDIRIRLRSRGPEIEELAKMYNGGGHAKAAGASLESLDDLDKFLSDVDKYIEAYKEH